MCPAEQVEPKAPEPSRRVKVIATLLTLLVVLLIAGFVYVVDGAGWYYLAWAKRHPAFVAKYDPHHWGGRVAVLLIVLSFRSSIVHALTPSFAAFSTWRRVFMPFSWEAREQPEQAKTELSAR